MWREKEIWPLALSSLFEGAWDQGFATEQGVSEFKGDGKLEIHVDVYKGSAFRRPCFG